MPPVDEFVRWAERLGFTVSLHRESLGAVADGRLDHRDLALGNVSNSPVQGSDPVLVAEPERVQSQTGLDQTSETASTPPTAAGCTKADAKGRTAGSIPATGAITDEERKIAEFIASRGVTVLPPAGDPELAELAPLHWDHRKKAWTRAVVVSDEGVPRSHSSKFGAGSWVRHNKKKIAGIIIAIAAAFPLTAHATEYGLIVRQWNGDIYVCFRSLWDCREAERRYIKPGTETRCVPHCNPDHYGGRYER